MAISIDPLTYVIYVPKSDLTLKQTVPTEIREMNINWFRLALKAWEDDVEGIVQLKTHIHNTEVTLGALTFARVVEILDPYTITFEDGQYAVDLVGANSNIGDKTNVNQVSVRSYNSAGLISSPAIEYSSFNGGVIIDVNSGITGTVFPRGTEQMPVNNLGDALLIAEYRGFNKLYLHSDIYLDSGSDLDDFILEGQSHVYTEVEISEACSALNVTIQNCMISGTLDGNTSIDRCIVSDITYMNGHIHDSSFTGTIELAGGKDAYINNCYRLDVAIVPIIDMGGSGQDLVITNYSGAIKITNLTGSNKAGIGLNSGTVVLDSNTVTSGSVTVSGVGRLVDENGNTILTGTWNGGVTVSNFLINAETVSDAVWSDDSAVTNESIAIEVWGSDLADYDVPGTLGFAVRNILGLQQHNFRLKNQQYEQIDLGNNNFKYVLTDATIRVYDNATDAGNDVNEFAEYTLVASYNSNGNCTSYSVLLN
jgi:hypothetical protein